MYHYFIWLGDCDDWLNPSGLTFNIHYKFSHFLKKQNYAYCQWVFDIFHVCDIPVNRFKSEMPWDETCLFGASSLIPHKRQETQKSVLFTSQLYIHSYLLLISGLKCYEYYFCWFDAVCTIFNKWMILLHILISHFLEVLKSYKK